MPQAAIWRRPPFSSLRLRGVSASPTVQGSRFVTTESHATIEERSEKDKEDIPAICLARIMAATFSLVFACSEPDICKKLATTLRKPTSPTAKVVGRCREKATGDILCSCLSVIVVSVRWTGRLRQTHLASLLLQVLLPRLVTLVTTSHIDDVFEPGSRGMVS